MDEAPDVTWCAIDQALRKGGRCLPTGSGWSLAQLLAERRGVRNKKRLPDFTIKQILMWADAHHLRTGAWPNWKSGPIAEAPGETWLAVDKALRNGTRGMTGPSSLGLLLAARRGVRNNTNIPQLTLKLVLQWADAYFKRHGCWPTRLSGPIPESPGDTWYAIDAAFHAGNRGLVGYKSLAHFLAVKRGYRYRFGLPDLTIEQILEWARGAIAGWLLHRINAIYPFAVDATALVHEAYLRLVDTDKVQLWNSRWHFFHPSGTGKEKGFTIHST